MPSVCRDTETELCQSERRHTADLEYDADVDADDL
jgi:hypothetical protein